MHLTKEDIRATERVKRLNLINSISGIKPANLIGTISSEGITNLAIFSSVVHLGTNPPLLGMITRPDQEVRRHTLENIKATGVYTINHVSESFIEKAHYTSAKVPAEQSEFEACQLTEEFQGDFKAPFVKESPIKLGMKYVESIPIQANDTELVIGEIQHLIIPDEIVAENGWIDLGAADIVGISGLNSYYQLQKIDSFPYARPDQIPDFDQ